MLIVFQLAAAAQDSSLACGPLLHSTPSLLSYLFKVLYFSIISMYMDCLHFTLCSNK